MSKSKYEITNHSTDQKTGFKRRRKGFFIESYIILLNDFKAFCHAASVPKTKSKHWYSLFEILCWYVRNIPVAICFDLWIDLFKGRRIWTQDYFQDINTKSQINCVNVSILFFGGDSAWQLKIWNRFFESIFFPSPNSVDTRSAKATFMAKHCTRKCTIFRVYVHSYLDSSLSFSKPEKIQILTSRTRPLHSDAKCLENIGFYMFILTLR